MQCVVLCRKANYFSVEFIIIAKVLAVLAIYIDYKNGKAIEHYSFSEINQIKVPDELLQSLARALVPDFQAYIQAKREQEKGGQSSHT